MDEISRTLILYPVFAMFLLVAIVLVRLGQLRVRTVGKGDMPIRYYKTYDDGVEPAHLRVVTRNFINLFELPVLFYVGAILTYVTHQVSYWMVGCAWIYVALRYAHSYVHLTSNYVPVRFRVYIASGAVLVVMWVSLLVGLLRDG